MKQVISSLFVLFVCIGLNNQAMAQSEEENRKWMEYATPGSMQKMMASWDGEWEEDITFWMAPGMQEQKMQSSCSNRMILDGRYQESTHTGNFGGMPFHGISVLGWDNVQKIFVNSWIDNMGTGMMFLTGGWDEKNNTMELRGTLTDPMSGQAAPVRQVIKIIDDRTQIMEQYSLNNGKEFMSMKIIMKKRVKGENNRTRSEKAAM